MNLLIKNARLLSEKENDPVELLSVDGKIAAIGTEIIPNEQHTLFDAEGMILLPGGVDPHVHLHLPWGKGYSADDFEQGSRAALLGGTTTIIDFVTPHRGQSLTDALAQRINEAENCLVDYSFHISPVEWRKSTAREIADCVALGFPSFKVYLAYLGSVGLHENDLRKVMMAVADAGGMLTAHCENGDAIEDFRNKKVKNRQLGVENHPLTRPAHTEAEAVAMAIRLANETNCTLYVVHVSTSLAINMIAEARSKGQKVFGETCPQYLLFDDTAYQLPFNEACRFVMSPPLRKKSDQEALWNALSTGSLDVLATDHCPFTMEMKQSGRNDFRNIPGGAPGLHSRLQSLYSYGFRQRQQLSAETFHKVFAARAAEIFGLGHRKGKLLPGMDADLVLYKPSEQAKKHGETLTVRYDTDIYQDITVYGEIVNVVRNGQLSVQNGVVHENGRGQLLKRFVSL